jgi:cyclopropane fatty-acyl-phospholipid synthase-like methyltransferase
MKGTTRKSESAKYWEEHLLSWEASAYYKDAVQQAGWWDRLSTVFRGNAMYTRMTAALELIRPYLKDATILDLGCASGRFPFQMLRAGAAKVHGMDISAEAIGRAKEHAARLGLQDRVEFSVMDVVQPNAFLPHVDLVTALGVIEYFHAEAMSVFLGNLRTRYFFLDFPDYARKKEFPTWALRQVYIRVHRLPGVYLYTPEEFIRLAEPHGFKDIWVAFKDGFYYVTNLPRS